MFIPRALFFVFAHAHRLAHWTRRRNREIYHCTFSDKLLEDNDAEGKISVKGERQNLREGVWTSTCILFFLSHLSLAQLPLNIVMKTLPRPSEFHSSSGISRPENLATPLSSVKTIFDDSVFAGPTTTVTSQLKADNKCTLVLVL